MKLQPLVLCGVGLRPWIQFKLSVKLFLFVIEDESGGKDIVFGAIYHDVYTFFGIYQLGGGVILY